MASRNGPVHVVTNVRKYKGRQYTTHLLRRSYRVGKKVMKETVANLSHLPEELIDLIRRYLKGERFATAQEIFQINRTLPHGHVAAVLGSLRGSFLDKLLGDKPSRKRTLVVAMIVARIIAPQSKLATARGLGSETLSTSLGDELGLESVKAEDLYEAMDWLAPRQAKIEDALAKRHLADGSLVLYDVTSVYFEGRVCPLAKLGHNRDGKKGKLQIVVGLLCNGEGCPISVEVFEGNTGDPKTLLPQIAKLKSRFGLTRVVLVGDRGMLTEARLREDVRPEEGLDWITALRGPAIRGLLNAGSLQLSLFDEREMAEITDPQYPGERLIVCRNPLLAEERARKREELIRATEEELNEIVLATTRARQRLSGADKIGLRVGKVLNHFKVGKYFQTEIDDDSFRFSRDEARITEDAMLDGFYVIRTSLPQEVMSAQRTVSTYKSLSQVERVFRSLKSVDLKVRPIHHHLEGRVRTHVFICMLASYVEWHMRKALAPILFDDDHKLEAEARRTSIVAPAKRSEQALAKAQNGTTEDGYPVHSFQSLLADLATLAKNVVSVNSPDTTFVQYTAPTPVQKKALDLLNVSVKL
ncbi:MAG: IS1634 family transposase [Chloroflexota bacterium]|nr:IS1634 family transposase [Chloroflexota bacterium]